MDGAAAEAFDAAALVEAALAAQRAGRLDEAESHYRRILERLPEHAAATHFLGILRYQQGHGDEGVDWLRKSVALAPDAADWHNDLGNMLAAAGRDAEAAAAFMAALEVDPDQPVVWNNLGAVLQRGGQLEEARLSFENASVLDPACADALNNLGATLTRLGRAEEAARAYCAAYVLPPHGDKPKQMLGIAYYTLGRIEDAARIYRAWLDAAPDNPIARHLLAACSGQDVPERAADAYVESHFDDYAQSFDAKLVDSLAYQIPARIGEALGQLALAPGALTVLDAGCGTGLCGPRLAPYAKHLVGVDLSAKSLAVAAGKAVYDELVKAELVEYLAGTPARFDLIAAADTLIYFGSLDKLLRAAAGALAGAGLLIASVEALSPTGSGFAIAPSGRYRHSRDYLLASFAAAGFGFEAITPVDVRVEVGQPVKGLLLVARKRG